MEKNKIFKGESDLVRVFGDMSFLFITVLKINHCVCTLQFYYTVLRNCVTIITFD